MISASLAYGQWKYEPTPENLKTREWFQDAKFGLFIHWGVYSVLGDGEWVMNQQQIPVKTYEKIPSFFNPVDFDPKAWVQMVKDAGMKYIVITSKHHDGYALWPSKEANNTWNFKWNARDIGPQRDLLGDLFKAVRKTSVHAGMYYSLYEWFNPASGAVAGTGSMTVAGRQEVTPPITGDVVLYRINLVVLKDKAQHAQEPRLTAGAQIREQSARDAAQIDGHRQPAQIDLVEAIAGTGTPVVAIALRGPWDVAAYPPHITALATYSILPASLDAMAAVLAGGAQAPGRLPVATADSGTLVTTRS
jgi:hypothetical protein